MNSTTTHPQPSASAMNFTRPPTADGIQFAPGTPGFRPSPALAPPTVGHEGRLDGSDSGQPFSPKPGSPSASLASGNSKPTQKGRWLAINTILGEDEVLLTDFSMTEQLGGLFELEVELVSSNPGIRFDDIVGTNATVRLRLPNGNTRYFNGIVSRFVQNQPEHRFARYRATLVPWLWLLTRASDCRIFQNKPVPAILEEVFGAHKFTDYELRLNRTYGQRENCVQYRETDFAFVSRLMEEEGIHYFFRHENGKHTLVLADSNSALVPAEGYECLPFLPPSHPLNGSEEVVTDWRREKEVQPGQYAHADFNFKTPHAALLTTANISRDHAQAHFEMFDYPGKFHAHDEGEACAKLRIEEAQCRHEIIRAQTSARGLGAGCSFTLIRHPRSDENRAHLVTSASYRASAGSFESVGHERAGGFFSCAFTAMPLEQEFRPARTTCKPAVHGPQTAIVVGPEGEEIHTDEFGRVKAKFHWDRAGKEDDNASCWMRVSQAAAGKGWGALSLPRVGHEVIVEFLEGDPDQPIITGRIYNGANRVPYPLPQNKTISTFKSNSTKGGDGFNEFRFDDKKGEEQVFLHAERNQDIRVKNDCFEWIGHNRHLIVKQDQIEHIESNRHETVDADHREKIGKDRHLKVMGKQAIEIGSSHFMTVRGDVIEVFKGNHAEQTADNYFLKAAGVVVEALQGLTLKCGGSHIVIDPSGVTIKGPKVTIDGASVLIASGPGSPPDAGNAATPVSPALPDTAEEADDADPGEISQLKAEQRLQGKGKYGSVPVKAGKPPLTAEEKQRRKSWIEIELVDDDGQPVPGEPYRVTLPDGQTVAEGTLDQKGFARVDGIEPGTCKITFPNLERDAWRRA